MIVSKNGRSYTSGKALRSDLRTAVIDHIVQQGGDVITGFFQGSYTEVAKHFNLSRMVVQKLWRQCCEQGDITNQWKGGNNPPRLQKQDLDFIEALKTATPSMPHAKIYDAVNTHCNIPTGTSKSAIARAVQSRLDDGKTWTWKRMSRPKAEKFTHANVDYCQDFLNYMSTINPHRIKCFDEAGFKLPDVGRPNYGHSLVNTPCLEVGRYLSTPNVTLNLLMGIEGVLYANTEDGASDTASFLNFWGEVGQSLMSNGQSILQYGDIIVLDNCAVHHYAGGYALSAWLLVRGVDVVYLPVYSPELNPCELVFNKLKCIAKRDDIKAAFCRNVHEGIYESLQYISGNDCVGFYRHTDYIAM